MKLDITGELQKQLDLLKMVGFEEMERTRTFIRFANLDENNKGLISMIFHRDNPYNKTCKNSPYFNVTDYSTFSIITYEQ